MRARHICFGSYLLIWLSGFDAFSQTPATNPPSLHWVRLVTNECYSSAGPAIGDLAGNIYFGSGPNNPLAKFDQNGNLVWRILSHRDCGGHIFTYGLSLDASNNLFMVGDYWGNVNIGGFLANNTSGGCFFGRMNPDTTFSFVKFGHSIYRIAPTLDPSNGHFFFGGTLPGPPNSGSYEGITLGGVRYSDIALFKVQPTGAPVWALRGIGNSDDNVDSTATTPAGDVYVSMNTYPSTNFAIGSLIANFPPGRAQILFKVDAAGTPRWLKTVAPAFEDQSGYIGGAVACSPSGRFVYWTGGFGGNLGLTATPTPSRGGSDIFLTKVTTNGAVIWTKTFGGVNNEAGAAITVDSAENIYLAGIFWGQFQIGSYLFNSQGEQDIFLAKLDGEGNLLWAKQIGYIGSDRVSSLSLTPRGELLVTGTTEGGILVDGQFFQGVLVRDAFLVKFHAQGNPPAFSNQPTNATVSGGMTTTFRSEVLSTIHPTTYQWWFNGNPLAGQTNATLVLTNVQPNQAGGYYVVAQNPAGTNRSTTAVLTYSDASTLNLGVYPSLEIFGTPGRTYRIEYAFESAPTQWTVATNIFISTSPQLWIDRSGPLAQRRFYRVLLVP